MGTLFIAGTGPYPSFSKAKDIHKLKNAIKNEGFRMQKPDNCNDFL